MNTIIQRQPNPINLLQTFYVVVENARETAQHYARITDSFHWTVWESAIQGAEGNDSARYRGATAATPWGIDVTLIEPIDKSGTYWDFLNQQGPGVHSLVVRVNSENAFNPAASWLTDAGITLVAEEQLGGEIRRTFDTQEDLGGYHLVVAVGDKQTPADAESWDLSSYASRPASVPPLPFCPLQHFGILVSNRARYAHRYNQLWGITDWVFADYWTAQGSLDDPLYLGKPANHGFHCGFAFNFLNFGFELIQPAEGISDYRMQFDARGPSVHHMMNIWVTDQDAFAQSLKWLESLDVNVVQFSHMDGGKHVYWYLDTRSFLGIQFEAYGMLADLAKDPPPNMAVDYSSDSLVRITPTPSRWAREPVRVLVQMQMPDSEGANFRESFTQWGNVSAQDGGCVQYELFQSTTSPGRFALLELWENPAAYDAHWKQEWQRWGARDISADNPDANNPDKAGLIGTELYSLQNYEVPDGRWIPKLFPRKGKA